MHAKKNFKVVHSASMRPEDWLRFIHIDPFPGQWKRLKLSEEDLRALEVFIASAPTMAPVVPGSGGLRKFRFAVPGSQRGKSGAYRVFYVYFEDYGHVILWAIIDKHQDDDLPKARLNAIAEQIARLKRLLDEGFIL